jgi:hypothetical protein
VVQRTCTVAVKDVRDVEHSVEVTAETLYEAIATALAALQQDNWVGEIGQGFTTVSVLVQQPPVKHEVKMKDFLSWLGRQGRSPAEVVLKQKLEKILRKLNHLLLPANARSSPLRSRVVAFGISTQICGNQGVVPHSMSPGRIFKTRKRAFLSGVECRSGVKLLRQSSMRCQQA